MNPAWIRAVSPVMTEPSDLILLWPSDGHHVGAEGVSSRSILDHALSFTPEMDLAALRVWAQTAKYLAEREGKSKDNLPLNDPWAEGARTAISFLDPLVRTESWHPIQKDNYYGALARLKAMISQRERLVRERKSMPTRARKGMEGPDNTLTVEIGNTSRER
ncbi:hypothetical protein [Bosea rubneri]|uniref:Uncharacterized protein n=1 Tax=Bosea rubneri TaxID=3075434 RepID=A0ABU3SDL9_9HYPH|nr:hypothetical protein [Bosea sp. ZW T0_25]MDU0342880.1 hypothetical protein [Bosea sp. ZW T0_25]